MMVLKRYKDKERAMWERERGGGGGREWKEDKR